METPDAAEANKKRGSRKSVKVLAAPVTEEEPEPTSSAAPQGSVQEAQKIQEANEGMLDFLADDDEVFSDDDEDPSPKTISRFQVFREALQKPPELRTSEDVDQIFQVMMKIDDPFFKRLETGVMKSVCERLCHQECKPGEMVFDYGDVGDRLYLIWSGRVCLEVPREKAEDGKPMGGFVKFTTWEVGKVFGEMALMSEDKKRKGRITAVKATELLTLTDDDYRWCMGFSQENFVRELVTYLKSMEGGLLEDINEADLQGMAGCLVEENYIGGQEILRQENEVNKVIFVKRGFCDVVRKVHPRCKERFLRWANNREPMPNPYADGEGGLLVGQKGVWPQEVKMKEPRATKKQSSSERVTVKSLAAELGLGSRPALRKLLRKFPQATEEFMEEPPSPKSSSGKTPKASTGKSRVGSTPRLEEGDGTDEGLEGREELIVDTIGSGCSFGVMELMEGLCYQSSVIAAPCAHVYSISKFDFIRNVSKVIIHKLFVNYKARLTEKHLMHRLKQKSRWEHYKRELCEEIRSRDSAMARGIIDRYDPPPHVGVSGLPEEDYHRVGKGEKLWDQRAQTPPNMDLNAGDEVQQIFHVTCTRDEKGKPLVTVNREQRDASMVVLEEKLVKTIATARYREKLKRKQAHEACGESLEESDPKSQAFLPDSNGQASDNTAAGNQMHPAEVTQPAAEESRLAGRSEAKGLRIDTDLQLPIRQRSGSSRRASQEGALDMPAARSVRNDKNSTQASQTPRVAKLPPVSGSSPRMQMPRSAGISIRRAQQPRGAESPRRQSRQRKEPATPRQAGMQAANST